MEALRTEITIGFVAVYMLFCVLVGVWAMRRTRSSSDFFVAGRHLGPLVVALAVFSSTLSGFGFVGGPGLVYSSGMSSLWMVIVAGFGYALAALLWFSIGIVMRASALDGGIAPLSAPDEAAPVFLAIFAHPLLAGIVFAALFAAIMSTSDAFLNIGTAAVIHDIPNALRGRSVDNELFWARIVTVLITLVAAAFALYSYYGNDRLVALLGAFGWGTFAAALVPVVVFGLNWKRATAKAAIVAIVASLTINFGVEIFSLRLPFGISGPFLAMATSMMLFLLISLVDRKPKLAADIDRILDF